MTKLATVFCLAFLCTTAVQAQNLVVEREVPLGYRPASLVPDHPGRPRLSPDAFDLNVDGSPEIVMIRNDAQDTPQELVVMDVAANPPEVLWTLDLNAVGGALDTKFHGFFDIFEVEHPRAAVFGEEGVWLFSPDLGSDVVFSLDADHRLLGVVDLDGDNLAELIIENKVTDILQVWGAGATGRPRH